MPGIVLGASEAQAPWEGRSVPCVGLTGVCCDLPGTVVGSTGLLEL